MGTSQRVSAFGAISQIPRQRGRSAGHRDCSDILMECRTCTGTKSYSNEFHDFWNKRQKTYAKTCAPHHHSRTGIGPCIVQRSTHVFCTAKYTPRLGLGRVFSTTNCNARTRRSFRDRLHRWDRRDGTHHRSHHSYPHPGTQKILDRTIIKKALTRLFHFISLSNYSLLQSFHRAADENKT